MKYTKEQAEMLTLLVLAGLVLLILSFVYLVKPPLAVVAESRGKLKKMEKEIAGLSEAYGKLGKAQREKKSLTETIEHGEKTVFAGMETGFVLSQICVKAASLAEVTPAYLDRNVEETLQFSEKTGDGTETTRHYDTVSRMLTMSSVDFFSLCDFLGAVEQANEGLRVSGLRIESTSGDSGVESQEETVTANVNLSLLGIREGQPPDASSLVVNVPGRPDVASMRNPFGPAQERRQAPEDPMARAREVLQKMKMTGTIGEWLLLEFPAGTSTVEQGIERVSLRRGQTTLIGGVSMRYVGTLGDKFVFDAIAHDVRFTLEADHKGEVTTVKEEKKR